MLQLFWLSETGDRRCVELDPSATVGVLKQAIRESGGPPMSMQILRLGMEQLSMDDSTPLADTGLSSEALVTVMSCNRRNVISAGESHVAVVLDDGQVHVILVSHGSYQQDAVPDTQGRQFRALSTGFYGDHILGILADGSAVGWGRNCSSQAQVPAELKGKHVLSLATGALISGALCGDGTVVCWGDASDNVACVPDFGGRRAIDFAIGSRHCLVVLEDGSVVAWGLAADGISTVPDLGGQRAVAVTAGHRSSAALLSDGTVASWGNSPAGLRGAKDVAQVSLGYEHAVGVTSQGQVRFWPDGCAHFHGCPRSVVGGYRVSIIVTADLGLALAPQERSCFLRFAGHQTLPRGTHILS